LLPSLRAGSRLLYKPGYPSYASAMVYAVNYSEHS